MRAPLSLSLSLSGWWHATTTTTTGENENERERKNRKLFCNIFCAFSRARKKNFSESFFFLPLLRFQNAPRAMRSNKNNNDTNRREKERERVRETSFSLSRDRKNALLSALLCVCAGVRKKTILINLNTTRAKNFLSLLDICFVGFFALVFLDCFFKGHVSPPVFSLKVMKI